MTTPILALDSAGNPIRWIDYERAAYLIAKGIAKGRLAWTPAESNIVLHGGINAATDKQSTMSMPLIIAIKGKTGKPGLFKPRLTKKGLHRRDNNICCYCGNHFKDDDLTADHVIPISRSGPTIWLNLVSACFPCNNRKRDRTPEEANMPMKYKSRIPNRAEYLYFINLNKAQCQIDYLNNYMSKK